MRVVVNCAARVAALAARLLQRAADRRVADGDLGDLAAAHERLELAVRDRRPGRRRGTTPAPSASSRSKPSTYQIANAGRAAERRRSPGLRSRGSMRGVVGVGTKHLQGRVGRDRAACPASTSRGLRRLTGRRLVERRARRPSASTTMRSPSRNSPSSTRMRQRIEHAPLDRPLERPRAVGRVVAFLDEQVFAAASVSSTRIFRSSSRFSKPAQLDVDDLLHVLAAERVEDDDLVDAVEELRPEVRPQRVHHLPPRALGRARRPAVGGLLAR